MCPKVIKRDIKCHAYDPKLAAEGPQWVRFLSRGEFIHFPPMCIFIRQYYFCPFPPRVGVANKGPSK